MSKVMRAPPSARLATSVIVSTTVIVVVIGGVLMRLLDHAEYDNVWVGMWWAVQTVTTVGYGDVTPTRVSGRIVATFVMLEGIAFLTIIIAVITSTFIARAARERAESVGEGVHELAGLEARLDELGRRLDRLEAMLAKLTGA
jgi:voltage-gated potassium channel Kch